MFGSVVLHNMKVEGERRAEKYQFWRDVFLTQVNRHGDVNASIDEANRAVDALEAKFKVSED